MQALPPARQTPLTPSPLVPTQQTPRGAEELPAPSTGTQRRPLPAPRPEHAGRHGLPGVPTRIAQPDAVVFTAPCPACGADCDWTEQRDDTRLHASVSCSCS